MEQSISLQFEEVTIDSQEEAKEIILEGLGERFGYIDYSLNPDLDQIVRTYSANGDCFLTVYMKGEMVGTGALIIESDQVGRIARMSVKKEFRGKGIASQMLERLINTAKQREIEELVLETNLEWVDAVRFYQKHGFKEYERDVTQIHMNRKI
ncbi:GNAT family N-acetyltransferase [Bacillus horti]|uniref:N-acetylglutamate synthase-like GNAT family acetyltransferase n=1 Tax=Caldalkalibacillus horti TaxID=77523 RepID=A0ABT9W3T4_9BACI|nr:GNAT family N-acetyltransferase [Bacillus horti]MDQ0167896.1 N-acetylglutamate synthase-like GNAT family acetyltransferase [Bacillus horti]